MPYVDVPLQHASGAVLRRMRRSGDGAAHLALLDRVRAALPGAAVRSTFIAGFPGETDAEFEELVAFVRDAGLAVAGVFVYDAQEGTAGGGHARRRCPRGARLRARRAASARPSTARPSASGRPRRRARSTSSSSAARRAPDGAATGRVALQAPDVDGRTIAARRAGAARATSSRAVVVDSLGYDVEAVAATGGT